MSQVAPSPAGVARRYMLRPGLVLALVGTCAVLAASSAGIASSMRGAGIASSTPCRDSSTPVDELSIDQFDRAVVCVTNQWRAEAGRSPVRPNAILARAATRHSDAMVSGGFFSHFAPGGRGLTERARTSGYVRGASRWRVGETLRWSIRELSSPSAVVEAWIKSPPHRRVLLDDQFREIGVGAVLGAPVIQEPAGAVTVTSLYGLRKE